VLRRSLSKTLTSAVSKECFQAKHRDGRHRNDRHGHCLTAAVALAVELKKTEEAQEDQASGKRNHQRLCTGAHSPRRQTHGLSDVRTGGVRILQAKTIDGFL
jgi:hypothetical protein